MNAILEHQYPLFELYQGLRNDVLAGLSDEDLAYSPGGGAPTLGELCLEIGETEQAYIDSFRTFRLDFSYRHPQRGLSRSVSGLQAWYAELDAQLHHAVESLSDADLENRKVDRGPDFKVSPGVQLEIYKEALLIFYGKVWVYLQITGKKLPARFADWIG